MKFYSRLLSLCIALAWLLSAQHAHAQAVSIDTLHAYGLYDTDRLPPSFHAGRRQLVLAQMPPHTIALFTAAPEQTRSNDVSYLYKQDPNFYYLTGHLESHAALVLSSDPIQASDGTMVHEIMFVEPRNLQAETWTGHRLGPQGAKSVLGFHETREIDELPAFLKQHLPNTDTLYYLPRTEQSVFEPDIDSTINVWAITTERLHDLYPHLKTSSLTRQLAMLRMQKTPEELVLLRKAISISNEAHNEIMKSVKPGWYEYQIQALGEYVFGKNGAEYTGYPSIVGSGENSTILHYETNRRQTKSGDFIEMDMGAEYHGYSADVTRSYPVNGTFTPEQRAIYNLVLEAQDSGIVAARVGNSFRAPLGTFRAKYQPRHY